MKSKERIFEDATKLRILISRADSNRAVYTEREMLQAKLISLLWCLEDEF